MLIDFILNPQISNVFSVFLLVTDFNAILLCLNPKGFQTSNSITNRFHFKATNFKCIFHFSFVTDFNSIILKAFRLVIGLYHNRFHFKSTNFKYIFCFLFVTGFNSIIVCCNPKGFQTSNSIL